MWTWSLKYVPYSEQCNAVQYVHSPSISQQESKFNIDSGPRDKTLDWSGQESGYDEYSLLDLYSGFFDYSYPTRKIYYSTEQRVVAKRHRYSKIFYFSTQTKSFLVHKLFLGHAFLQVCYLCPPGKLLFSFSVRMPTFQTVPVPHVKDNFQTDLIAKINSPIIMMMGARNENQHQIIGLHTLLEITR